MEHQEDKPHNSFHLSPVSCEGNCTTLYIDGPAILEMYLREIKKAQHFIHIQVMLFYSDEAGMEIAHALADKASQGVEVRVMSDSEMSYIVRLLEKFRSRGTSNFDDLKQIFNRSGVKFVTSDKESYFIANWKEKRADLAAKGVPEEFLKMQDLVQESVDSGINVFDHRKILVIDGETAVITGSNIGKKYLYHSEDREGEGHHWHDGAVVIKGPFASILNKHFASKWMVRGGDVFDPEVHYRTRDRYGADECSAFSRFPGQQGNPIRSWYFDKVRNCAGDLLIENPYINDDKFFRVLSGLDPDQARKIKVINPYGAKGNDYPQNVSAIKCNMWKPSSNGVVFYAYSKRMTHWKVALDVEAQEVFVGSYNLNYRSALHDFEFNVLIKSKHLSQQVQEMLQTDMESARKITDANEFHENPMLHSSCLLLDGTEYFE